MSNTTGTISGTGSAFHYGAPVLTLVFRKVLATRAVSSVLCCILFTIVGLLVVFFFVFCLDIISLALIYEFEFHFWIFRLCSVFICGKKNPSFSFIPLIWDDLQKLRCTHMIVLRWSLNEISSQGKKGGEDFEVKKNHKPKKIRNELLVNWNV